MTVAIKVENLSKKYVIGAAQERQDTLRDWLVAAGRSLRRRPTAENEFWALRDVSFEVQRGEVVGVIGRNGAGKSTLLKILSRITEPTSGRAYINGRVGSLLEVGTGFHPELTGRENIFLNGAILGMRRTEIARKFDEIVAFAEIEKFLDTPVKRYSSGMYVRLAFAVAAHLEPEILLVDEVLAVGDAAFQKKCLGKMGDVAKEGRTVLFVSHNMTAVNTLCQRALLLSLGRVICDGLSQDAINKYYDGLNSAAGIVIWNNISEAPGNEVVRLHSVKVRQGSITEKVDIDKEFQIEIEFWNLKDDVRLYSYLRLIDSSGYIVLDTASFTEANAQKDDLYDVPLAKGLYRSVCKIPANFLNDQTYRVTVAVATLSPIQDVYVYQPEIVGFTVFDTGVMRTPGANGKWPGTVRVKMDWKTLSLGTQNDVLN